MTTAPVERVLAALRAAGHEPKRNGSGWSCSCPAHDDRNPSLSINAGNDGQALVLCHAGCETAYVLAELKLEFRHLFEGDSQGGRTSGKRSKRKTTQAQQASQKAPTRSPDFATPKEAVASLESRRGPPLATWAYHDAAGELCGLVVRWDPEGGGKVVRPVAKVDGRWRVEAMPKLRPLYGLRDLLASEPGSPVVVCEGEKAADSARACGYVATTSAGGSKAAAKSDWTPLGDRDVWVLPDHDSAGEAYADDVVRLAVRAGARSVRVVRLAGLLPELPEGADLADVFDAKAGDVAAVRAAVDGLAAAAEDEGNVGGGPAAWPAFDLQELFPPAAAWAADYFAAVAESLQGSPAAVAMLGLAVASGACANVIRVAGHGDHKEPVVIWSIVLADSAARKSAVVTELVRPVLDWERERAAELAPAIAADAQRRRIDEGRLAEKEKKAVRAKSPDEARSAEAEAVRLAKELEAQEVRRPPVLLASEPTPEALGRQLAENAGRGLLASAEADALDILAGRYSGSPNFGTYLKAHAGDPIRVGRVGREGESIDRPALAVALFVQPAAVERLWADREAAGRGLLARFAIAAPPDLIGQRKVRPPAVAIHQRSGWQAGIRRLLSFEPAAAGEEPLSIGLDPAADALFHEFQKRTEAALGAGDLADRRAWGGKLVGLVLRIAGVLHALGSWARSGSPRDAGLIDEPTMRAAIAWGEFLAASERHARERIGEDEGATNRRELVRWIQQRGGSVTVRDLTHGIWQYRGRSDAARAALDELAEAGIGRCEQPPSGPKGGRPSARFRLFAGVTITETPHDSSFNGGIGDGDAGGDAEKRGEL